MYCKQQTEAPPAAALCKRAAFEQAVQRRQQSNKMQQSSTGTAWVVCAPAEGARTCACTTAVLGMAASRTTSLPWPSLPTTGASVASCRKRHTLSHTWFKRGAAHDGRGSCSGSAGSRQQRRRREGQLVRAGCAERVVLPGSCRARGGCAAGQGPRAGCARELPLQQGFSSAHLHRCTSLPNRPNGNGTAQRRGAARNMTSVMAHADRRGLPLDGKPQRNFRVTTSCSTKPKPAASAGGLLKQTSLSNGLAAGCLVRRKR